MRLDNISQTSHRLSELTGLPKLCLTLVCVPHLLVPIVSTAVAGGFLQLCTSGVWYLVVSEWSQNTAGVSPLCAPHGPEQVYFSNLVMGILQIAEFQSEFWHFLSLWPGLEEMLEINKRLFDRIAGENITLTHICCGCGNNCHVSDMMGG